MKEARQRKQEQQHNQNAPQMKLYLREIGRPCTRARISAHPNTSLPCPCNHIPPSPST
jgi:hypothetical protein